MAGDGMSVQKTGTDTPRFIQLSDGTVLSSRKYSEYGGVFFQSGIVDKFSHDVKNGLYTAKLSDGTTITYPESAKRKIASDPTIIGKGYKTFYNLPEGSLVRGTSANDSYTFEYSDGITVNPGAGSDTVCFSHCDDVKTYLAGGKKGDKDTVEVIGKARNIAVTRPSGETEIYNPENSGIYKSEQK